MESDVYLWALRLAGQLKSVAYALPLEGACVDETTQCSHGHLISIAEEVIRLGRSATTWSRDVPYCPSETACGAGAPAGRELDAGSVDGDLAASGELDD